MRSDMHEIIIERPRWGHTRGYPRRRVRNMVRARESECERESGPGRRGGRGGRGGDDDLPLREPMGGFYAEKNPSDNLAPLERYLRSNVGRPWRKVRSEIAAQLSATSAIQKHVMDHLREYVVERVWQDAEGKLWGPDRYGRPSMPWRFFVHPRTGALAEMPRRPRKRTSVARLARARPDVRILSPNLQLRRVRGIWYAVTIATLPLKHGPDAVAFVRDAIAKVDPREAHWAREHASVRDLWDEQRYARSIRQLSKREIREHLGS